MIGLVSMILPIAITKQSEIDQAVSDVVRLMAPDVVRIRHNIAQDWTGDWAVYFRVLISDEAGRARLREVTSKVESSLDRKLDPLSVGLFSYYNFRSVSEQAALREESWN